MSLPPPPSFWRSFSMASASLLHLRGLTGIVAVAIELFQGTQQRSGCASGHEASACL